MLARDQGVKFGSGVHWAIRWPIRWQIAVLLCLITTINYIDRQALSVVARLQNAAVSYMDYVRQTLWPSGLAYFYPHPMLVGGDGLVAGRIVLAVLGLSALTVLALAGLRRRPWLAVGWFWFLGTAVPVIGLVQLGMQARADRYTYVPSVGLLLMAAWSAWALKRAPGLRAATAALALLSVSAAGVATTMQLRHWRDSRALAERALSVTTDNFMAHDLLGSEFERDGDLRRAAEEIGTALEINPACNSCRLKLGLVLGNLGHFDRGRELLELTLRVAPGHMAGAIHGGLGAILQRQGDLGAARHHLQRALELEPGLAEARNNLAVVHEAAGRMVEARDELEQTVRSAPRYALAHKNLGGLLLILGDLAGAVRELERAIELEPELLAAHFKLAVVRVNRDELPAAVAGFERVLELDPQHIDAMYNLALVLNAMGRPTEAESYLQRILVLDPQHPDARAVLGDRVPQ